MAPRDNPEHIDRSTRFRAMVAALAFMVIVAATPAWAQQGSNVTIDYGVLNSLGPAPTVPRVLQPTMPRPQYSLSRRVPAGRAIAPQPRIVLTPPGRSKAKRTIRRSPPARRQSARTTGVERPKPRRAVTRKATPAPPKKITAKPKPRPKVAKKRPIPPPPISTTPLEPIGAKKSASTAAARTSTQDRPRSPPPAAKVSATPPTARVDVAPKPPPAPSPPPQTAAVPPADEGFRVGRSYRLDFPSGKSNLDGKSTTKLDEIAGGAKTDRSIRLKLLAYAGAPDQTASQSRRLSLSRALAVRSYLIDKGVGSIQFEVQAKGRKLEGGPPDRVDIIVTKR